MWVGPVQYYVLDPPAGPSRRSGATVGQAARSSLQEAAAEGDPIFSERIGLFPCSSRMSLSTDRIRGDPRVERASKSDPSVNQGMQLVTYSIVPGGIVQIRPMPPGPASKDP